MKKATLAVFLLSFAGAVATVPGCAQTLYNNFTQYSDTAVPYVAYGVFSNPYEVTDSFELGSSSTVASANLILWAYADSSTPQTGWDVNWSIGTTQYGNDVATGTDASPTSNYLNTLYDYSEHDSSYLFNLYSVTIPIPDVALSGGTEYWLTLSNTTNTQDGYAYWDASDGPSTAKSPAYSQMPSESFKLFGRNGPTSVPEASPFDLPAVVGVLAIVFLFYKRYAAKESAERVEGGRVKALRI
jgi:hypothetical protein